MNMDMSTAGGGAAGAGAARDDEATYDEECDAEAVYCARGGTTRPWGAGSVQNAVSAASTMVLRLKSWQMMVRGKRFECRG